MLISDGTTIKIDGTAIGEVRDIRTGGGGYGAVDCRHLGTTGLVPFLQSVCKDGGDISVDYIGPNPNVTTGVKTILITRSDASTATFSAFLLDDTENFSVGKEVTRTVRFKVTAAT